MKQAIIKILLLLQAVIFCAGCVQHSPSPEGPPHALAQTVTYRLQHSGVLDMNGHRYPLRGLLQLQPEKRHARILIMNEMGMKLLIAEIQAHNENDFETIPVFISPFLRAIPHFFAESMRCVFETYLAEKRSSDLLLISEEEPERISGHVFFKHTFIRNRKLNYTVELFLNSVSSTGS